jgi:hypothetical protein
VHDDEFWVPLVDEPIGDLVAKAQEEDAELAALVASPRRQLAFRTFAYIRVGLVLGELLMETEAHPEPGAWVEAVLAEPKNRQRVADEIRAVAREVAADPRLAEEELGADDAARERFRRFAKRSLGPGGTAGDA